MIFAFLLPPLWLVSCFLKHMWLLLRACPPLSFTANILEQQSKAGLIYFKVLQAGGGEFLLSLQCDSFQEKQKLVYEAEDFLIYILYQYVSKMINITVVITFLSVYMVASGGGYDDNSAVSGAF